jgi:uncharacterized membrane protein
MFSISLDTSDFESAGVNMLERKVYLVKLEDGASRLYDNRSRIAELSNHRVYSIEEINIGEALTPNQLNGIRLNGFGWVGGLTLIGVIFYMLFSGISSIKPVRASEVQVCSAMAISLEREMCYKGFIKHRFISRSQIPTDPSTKVISMETVPSLKAFSDGDTLLIVKDTLL